jgi:hypothetical protein
VCASQADTPKYPSQKQLRGLIRASPAMPDAMRTHWLRVLPHLSGAQRAELAGLLSAAAYPDGGQAGQAGVPGGEPAPENAGRRASASEPAGGDATRP